MTGTAVDLAPLANLGGIFTVCAALLWFAFRVYGRLEKAAEDARVALVEQLKREQDRAERAEGKLDAANAQWSKDVIPAVVEVTRLLQALERERR